MIRSLWKILACACILPFAIYLPFILIDSIWGEMAYWMLLLLFFFGAPWTLVWTDGWKAGLVSLAAGIVCVVVSFALLVKSYDVRTFMRWSFLSDTYKQEVSRQYSDSAGLQHIDWDGWGWGGNDTYAYLVHDPKDNLAKATRDSTGLRARGLPCAVWRIHRLEPHWYAVVFFTDTQWTSC